MGGRLYWRGLPDPRDLRFGCFTCQLVWHYLFDYGIRAIHLGYQSADTWRAHGGRGRFVHRRRAGVVQFAWHA